MGLLKWPESGLCGAVRQGGTVRRLRPVVLCLKLLGLGLVRK